MFYHSFCGLLDQYVHDLGNSDPEVNTSRQTLVTDVSKNAWKQIPS